MRYFLFTVFYLFLNSLIAQSLNELESFNDCSDNSWVIVQKDVNDPTWDCTALFGEPVIRLRGSNSAFKIWLVSELISFDQLSMPYISFKYINEIVNGQLELFFSTDFTGEYNFDMLESSSWSSIPLNLYPIGEDDEIRNAVFHPSIGLDFLENQTGYIAFRFSSSEGEFDFILDELNLNSDYYSGMEASIKDGNRCSDLKADLSALINNHHIIPYSDRSFDVWDSHFTTDLRLDDANDQLIIWDMYTDNPGGNDVSEFIAGRDRDMGDEVDAEGFFYNREHSFPTSWWGGDIETVQYSDIHYVIPVDKVVNAIRLNFPYGETDNPITVTENGSKMGISSLEGFTREVFEPIDEYKGDLARMHLYVSTRYAGMAADWKTQDSRGQRVLSGEEYNFFVDWYLNLLLKWHRQDPVSQKEIDRNNAVFSIQGNRNPFIDHPEYADLIWGNQDGVACDMITNAEDLFFQEIVVIQPNPVHYELIITSDLPVDLINLFDVNGQLILSQNDTSTINVEQLDKGMYILQFISKEKGQVQSQKIVKL